MVSTQVRTTAIMSDVLIEMKKQLHVLAEANRQAAKSGNQQQLQASQQALAAQLNKFWTTDRTYLSGLNLDGINLNGYKEPIRCHLNTAYFFGADLTQVNFTSSKFESCSFNGATLDRTVMAQTRFDTCFFDSAIIDAVDFRHATLRSCLMIEAVFRRYPQFLRTDMGRTLVSRNVLDHLKSMDDYYRPNPLPRTRSLPTDPAD